MSEIESKIEEQAKTALQLVDERRTVILDRISQYKSTQSLTPCTDTDTYLVQFLPNDSIARLSLCSRSMYKLAHIRKQFIGNKICLILDNSGSMQNEPSSIVIQESFAKKFLADLHTKAQVAVRLVDQSSSLVGKFQPLQDGCEAGHVWPLLEELFKTPNFYTGITPLFVTIAQALSDGFDTIIVVTDGQDSTSHSFADIPLYGKTLQHFVDEYNAQLPSEEEEKKYQRNKKRKNTWELSTYDQLKVKWHAGQPLSGFIAALSVAVPADKVFFPSIVGLNMKPGELADSNGLIPVHLIHDTNDNIIAHLARKVRVQTVSREAGGGAGSRQRVHLADARYQTAKEHARGFMKGEYKQFPAADNHHAISLYISHKQAQLLELERQTKAAGSLVYSMDANQWHLPPKSERKAGWAFKFAGNRRALAVNDLKQTRERCMAEFDKLSDDEIQQLTRRTAVYNHSNYIEYVKADTNERPNKRQKTKKGKDDALIARAIAMAHGKPIPSSVDSALPGSAAQSTGLSVEDFATFAGPKSKAWFSIAKKIPTKFYPVPISTYYWIIEKDDFGKTRHDRLILN